jgi:hypothetical protein
MSYPWNYPLLGAFLRRAMFRKALALRATALAAVLDGRVWLLPNLPSQVQCLPRWTWKACSTQNCGFSAAFG